MPLPAGGGAAIPGSAEWHGVPRMPSPARLRSPGNAMAAMTAIVHIPLALMPRPRRKAHERDDVTACVTPGNLPDPRALTCPVSVIWGDADPLYPAAEADYLTSAIRGQPYVPIPGGQHLHPEERPWELAEAIERCIQSQALGQAS